MLPLLRRSSAAITKEREILSSCTVRIESVRSVRPSLFREEILVHVGGGRRSDARFEPGDYLKIKHRPDVRNTALGDRLIEHIQDIKRSLWPTSLNTQIIHTVSDNDGGNKS